MPQFIVNDTFQFMGDVRKSGSVLTISKADLAAEVAKGKHPTRGTWLSGLLNHCSPEDDAALDALGKPLKDEDAVVDEADEEASRTATIRAEMDEMGAAYDRRWKLPKLENELIKAKKTRGL